MTVPDFLTDPARACRGVDPELFFAAYEGNLERAKEICSACPFQTPCLRYAVDNEERYGVFGGALFSRETERARAERIVNENKPARMDVPTVAPPNRRIGPSPRDQLYAAIHDLWERGLSDGAIALRLDIHPGAVQKIRTKLGLAPRFGPRGKRLAVSA